jgi:hypothetical protein
MPFVCMTLMLTVVGAPSPWLILAWQLSILVLALLAMLMVPPVVILRTLYRELSGDGPPISVPFVVVGTPDNRPPQVSRLFLCMLQYRVLREGHRYERQVENAELLGGRWQSPGGPLTVTGSEDGDLELDQRWENGADELALVRQNEGRAAAVRLAYRLSVREFLPQILAFLLRRSGFVLVSHRQVVAKGPEFADLMLARSACAAILPPRTASFLSRLRTTWHWMRSNDEVLEVELAAQGIFPEPLEMDSPHLWARLGVSEFPWAHAVPGPCIVLVNSAIGMPEPITGYVPFPVPGPGPKGWSAAARRLGDLVAQQGLSPLHSLSKMGGSSFDIAASLLATGLAPLADVYGRFRNAASDVERLLTLFDAYEVLIKYSYFVLAGLGRDQVADTPEVPSRLVKPSLGHWTGALEAEVSRLTRRDAPLRDDPLVRFWNGRLHSVCRDLVDTCNGVGLSWRGGVLRSHLGWLKWLAWLRNSTKGHGGVTDAIAMPVWHDFHVAFVASVEAMKELTLDATLLVPNDTGEWVAKVGLRRGPFRGAPDESSALTHSDVAMDAAIEYQSVLYDISPYVAFCDATCLTFNDARGSCVNYVDYADGRIYQVDREIAVQADARESP